MFKWKLGSYLLKILIWFPALSEVDSVICMAPPNSLILWFNTVILGFEVYTYKTVKVEKHNIKAHYSKLYFTCLGWCHRNLQPDHCQYLTVKPKNNKNKLHYIRWKVMNTAMYIALKNNYLHWLFQTGILQKILERIPFKDTWGKLSGWNFSQWAFLPFWIFVVKWNHHHYLSNNILGAYKSLPF